MNIKYRPDIDGLRAIAVLLVVLYHAKFPISGGFIGVDVFFVISGFLITKIIYSEINQGAFSFAGFYKRRVKRLIPAFLFMLIPVAGYYYLYSMPDDFVSFAKSTIFSLAGLSNFYFFLNTDYFSDVSLEPLLHTWSLAVEEQFYIVFPFILLASKKLSSNKRNLLAFLAILLGASIFASQYYALNLKNAAYMLLPFRFFELLIGSMLAIYGNEDNLPTKKANSLGLAGLIIILISAFTLDSESVFPGFAAVPVCIGAAMLIAARTGFASKFLSSKVMVYIGKTSYSFYLWHWPLITILQYRGVTISNSVGAAVVIASFALAAFSLHAVETPLRRIKWDFKKTFLVIYFIPATLAASLAYSVILNVGYPSRVDGISPELDKSNWPNEVRSECMGKLKVGNVNECFLGVKKQKPDGIMIGDSFGNSYTGFIDVLAKDAGLMIHDTMNSSTPSIPAVFVTDVRNKITDSEAQKIVEYTTKRANYAKSQRIVIISDFWGQYNDGNKRYRIYDHAWHDVSSKALEMRLSFIEDLLKRGVKVVIIARPYAVIGSANIRWLNSIKMRHADINKHKINYDGNRNERIEYQLKKRYPSITLIDPNDAICSNDGKCSANIGNSILFRPDGAHLNYSGSQLIGKEYLKLKANPLKGL